MTASKLVELALDTGFAPHISEHIPKPELSPEKREIIGHTTVPSGPGFMDWTTPIDQMFTEVATLGDVIDPGGKLLNGPAIGRAQRVWCAAERDPRVYVDDRGYLRPIGCVGRPACGAPYNS